MKEELLKIIESGKPLDPESLTRKQRAVLTANAKVIKFFTETSGHIPVEVLAVLVNKIIEAGKSR